MKKLISNANLMKLIKKLLFNKFPKEYVNNKFNIAKQFRALTSNITKDENQFNSLKNMIDNYMNYGSNLEDKFENNKPLSKNEKNKIDKKLDVLIKFFENVLKDNPDLSKQENKIINEVINRCFKEKSFWEDHNNKIKNNEYEKTEISDIVLNEDKNYKDQKNNKKDDGENKQGYSFWQKKAKKFGGSIATTLIGSLLYAKYYQENKEEKKERNEKEEIITNLASMITVQLQLKEDYEYLHKKYINSQRWFFAGEPLTSEEEIRYKRGPQYSDENYLNYVRKLNHEMLSYAKNYPWNFESFIGAKVNKNIRTCFNNDVINQQSSSFFEHWAGWYKDDPDGLLRVLDASESLSNMLIKAQESKEIQKISSESGMPNVKESIEMIEKLKKEYKEYDEVFNKNTSHTI